MKGGKGGRKIKFDGREQEQILGCNMRDKNRQVDSETRCSRGQVKGRNKIDVDSRQGINKPSQEPETHKTIKKDTFIYWNRKKRETTWWDIKGKYKRGGKADPSMK